MFLARDIAVSFSLDFVEELRGTRDVSAGWDMCTRATRNDVMDASTKQLVVVGARVVLVPYRAHHVPKYHHWMQDAELRHLTGSEELTLAEEYEMLDSWCNDEEKLTYIVLARELYDKHGDCEASMIGDVNLFLSDADDEDVGAWSAVERTSPGPLVGEVNIMIAEAAFRRRGLGAEAASLAMAVAAQRSPRICRFEAKIGNANDASIRMFEERLGFLFVRNVAAFEEKTFALCVGDSRAWNRCLAALGRARVVPGSSAPARVV